MPIGTAISRTNISALRKSELSRVVWLLRRQLLRTASRTRVQRDSQRGGADRYLAALQIPAHRQRCDAAASIASSPATCESVGGPGDLHAVVRRAREGDRRRHRVATRREALIAGPLPIRACAGSRRTPPAWTCRSKTSPKVFQRWRCRDRLRRAC